MPYTPSPDIEIEGHAIISANGMISDSRGDMPAELRNDADWRRFQAALDRAALVVMGRLGHERHPNSGSRRRVVVTSSVTALATNAADSRTIMWNPAGMAFEAVLAQLQVGTGVIAVTGGTRVFDLFLPRFDRFDLVTATKARIPGGRPCFSAGPAESVLIGAGLVARAPQWLDAEAGVVLIEWARPASRTSI
jgi:dihydrofolate reductase